MTINLFIQAITKLISGILLVGLTIFLSAGTILFPRGWLLMGILFIPMLLAGIVMMFKNPELLKKRLNLKEEQREQKVLISLSGTLFFAGFVTAGLTYRFNWFSLPKGFVIAGVIVFFISYILYAEVIRENEYLSRIIEVQVGQKVVDTGLYSIVRHPMYSTTVFLFLSMPLVMGSLYSFLIFLSYPFIIVKRIKNEEMFLEKNLNGYMAYKQKVKYRLIPFIW